MSSRRKNKNRNKPGAKVFEVETPSDDVVMLPYSFHDYCRRRNAENEQDSGDSTLQNPHQKETPSRVQHKDNSHDKNKETSKAKDQLDEAVLTQSTDKGEKSERNEQQRRQLECDTEATSQSYWSSTYEGKELNMSSRSKIYTTPPSIKTMDTSRKRKVVMPHNPYAKKKIATKKEQNVSGTTVPRKLEFETEVSDEISLLTQENTTMQGARTSTARSSVTNDKAATNSPGQAPRLKNSKERLGFSVASAITLTPTPKTQSKETPTDDWTPIETLDDSVLSQLMDQVEKKQEEESTPIASQSVKLPPLKRRKLVIPHDLDEETVNEMSQNSLKKQNIQSIKSPNMQKLATTPAKIPVRNPYLKHRSLPVSGVPTEDGNAQNRTEGFSSSDICSPPRLIRKPVLPNEVEMDSTNNSRDKTSRDSPIFFVRNPYMKHKVANIGIQKSKEKGTDDLFAKNEIDESSLLELMERVESQPKSSPSKQSDGKFTTAKRLDFDKVQHKSPDNNSADVVKTLLSARKELEDYVNTAYLGLRQRGESYIEPRKNFRDTLCERINFLQLNGDFPDSFIGAMHNLRELGNQVKRNNTLPRHNDIQTSILSFRNEKDLFKRRPWFLVN